MCKSCNVNLLSVSSSVNQFIKSAQQLQLDLGQCYFCGSGNEIRKITVEDKPDVPACEECRDKLILCWYDGCNYQSFNENNFEEFTVKKFGDRPFCEEHRKGCYICDRIITSDDDFKEHDDRYFH
jgi:hypothetical protein